MVRLYSFPYSEFFYSFPCFFVYCSIIYYCVPCVTYVGPFPFFVPLFVPIQHFPSIFFDPFHQFLSLCIFHIVFGFLFPSPLISSQVLAPLSPRLSPILPLSIHSSLFPFILSSTSLLVVFISLLLYSHNFHHLCPIRTFLSIYPSSSPFPCHFSLIPNFTPFIASPAALLFFFPRFVLVRNHPISTYLHVYSQHMVF
jgi:hypothetical protein